MRNKIPCQALKGMSSILLQGLSVHKGRSLRESRHLESSILKCSHVPRRLFHASRRCFPEQQRSTLKKFKVLWSKGGGRGKLHCLGYKKNKDKRCKKKKKRDLQEVQISSFCSILTPRSSDCSLLEQERCQLTWPVQEQWPSTACSIDRTTLRFSSTQQWPTRLMLPQPCYSPATVPPAFHHQSPCDIPPAHSWHMA